MKNFVHKLFLAAIFALLLTFISISIIRHRNYFSQGNDLAIFDQTAWLYSQGLPPHNTITQRLDYQDRYKPVMVFLGFIYRIFPGPETLLLAQALSLVCSGVFLYFIGLHFKLNNSVAAIITLSYLIFPGITSFIIDDFHEVSLFPFFYLGSVYFFLTKKKTLLIMFLVFSLIIRDYLTVFSAVFWFSIISFNTQFRHHKLKSSVIVTHVIMVGIMIAAIKIMGGIEYGSFTNEGDNLQSVIIELISHPQQALQQFFTPKIKTTTLLTSLGYFVFLPLFSLELLVPILFQFAGRFYDSVHPYRWTINYHYSGELAAMLAFGTVYRLSQLVKIKQGILITFLVASSLVVIKYHHSPLTLIIKKDFLQKKTWMSDNDELIKLIPSAASVATQNNLASHLSNRQYIYLLPRNPEADYVLIDLHPHQDQYNFNGMSYSEMNQLQSQLLPQYQLIARSGDSYLYSRE